MTNKSTGDDMVVVGRDIMITDKTNQGYLQFRIHLAVFISFSVSTISCIQIFLGHKHVLHPPLKVDQLNWQAQPAQIGEGGRSMFGWGEELCEAESSSVLL